MAVHQAWGWASKGAAETKATTVQKLFKAKTRVVRSRYGWAIRTSYDASLLKGDDEYG